MKVVTYIQITKNGMNTMDELIKKMVEELNLDEAVAQQAVEMVLNMVKDKLPEPIAGQIENLLNGENFDLSSLNLDDDAADGIMGALGGLFGKK